MRKLLSIVVFHSAVLFMLAAYAFAGTEISVTPDIHYTKDGGFFQASLTLPENYPANQILIIPKAIQGDIFMMPSTEQSTSAKGTIIITGRYGKPGRAGIDIFYRHVLSNKHKMKSTSRQVNHLMKISFSLPDREISNPSVVKKWAEQYRQSLISHSRTDSFPAYWNEIIAPRYGLPASTERAARNRDQRPDLYSIFSGAAAIQESLQLEVLAEQRIAAASSNEEVPLSTLAGPSVQSHPFQEMLKGKNPRLPGLSQYIPSDQYAVFFADITKEIELSDLMEEWGGNLLQQVEANARNFHVKEKIIGQLCLEQTLLTRLFGDKVIREIALTGQDPFLKEGTAMTVLFSLKDKDLFMAQMSKRFSRAVEEKGATRQEISISGKQVTAVTSADHRISCYLLQWGDVAVVSNSKEALARIIATQAGKIAALAASDDFRYMRTIFVQDSDEEDIFVYLSDPHIRSLVGPRWKIGEARRLRCAANMFLISNARLWFLADKKREPAMAELVSGGYLGKQTPVCPEHGKYDLDSKTGEVFCSLHNRVGLLTPVGEIPLTSVTKSEAQRYKTFVDNYNRYWTKYFDPIGIRIKLGDTIKVQTCILPLIENSWYDGLAKLAGNKSGTLHEANVLPRTVVSLRGDINTGWLKEDRVLEEFAKQDLPILQYLGGEISLNLCDGPVLLTPGRWTTSMLVQDAGRHGGEGLFIGFLLSALNLPTYLSVNVKDPKRVEELLPDMVKMMSAGFSVETYIIDHEGKTPIHTIALAVIDIKLRLYAAIVGDRLVIASRRDIITDLLSGKPLAPIAHAGNFEMSVYRDAFHELETVVNLGHQEDLRQACHNNLPLTNIMLNSLNMTPELMSSKTQSLRGYEPFCPSGGKYLLEDTGTATCSIHGNRLRPRQPLAGDEKSPTYHLVNSLEKINARLSFTPEGLMTTVEIKRKPEQKSSWFGNIFK